MNSYIVLIVDGLLLGVALAMDSFSLSIADGLANPQMTRFNKIILPLNFGFFQGIMPAIGWYCVNTISHYFVLFQKLIPWIGFFLLMYIGTDMIKNRDAWKEETEPRKIDLQLLLVQGIATSIDALSIGFAIADYSFIQVLYTALIIALTTFIICVFGIELGNYIGKKFYSHASVAGGLILIAIGINTLMRGLK
ncbi:MAG: manganese efflux pump [Oscillospiraceae bacterium]|nr:manganese efflux pump [Oscillospiraceae bacterium]